MTPTLSRESWTGLTEALRAFVSRRVSARDAEDVLQNALLRIHRGVASLADDERLVPWLYRVTRSAIADHYRRGDGAYLSPPLYFPLRGERSDSLGSAPLRLAHFEPLDPAELPEDLVDVEPPEREWLHVCVAPFLAEVPEPNQSAVRLIELEGLRVADAAARVGVPLPTMKARVRRGRNQLRQALERCCRFERDARSRVVGCDPRGPRTCGSDVSC